MKSTSFKIERQIRIDFLHLMAVNIRLFLIVAEDRKILLLEKGRIHLRIG
jgi:hypothetical protein